MKKTEEILAEPTCGGCAHAHAVPESLGRWFQCRHGPIQAVVLNGALTGMYPPVDGSCPGCSLHKQRAVIQ